MAVVGTRNWLQVAAGLLQRAGLTPRVLEVDRKWVPFCVPFWPSVRSVDVVHMVWGGDVAASVVVAHLLRKRIVWHWIGSDVMAWSRGAGWVQAWRWRLAGTVVAAHLADSPELAAELAKQGIRATVCRLLPCSIEADPMPLPETFRVLCYWTDERWRFYGGEVLLNAARRFPDVEFLVVGAEGRGASRLPNVRYLSRVDDMDRVYREVTVLVRMPEHDSLSVMVLEALARGRYVIYNKDFPCCERADSPEALHRALADVRGRTRPNHEGAELVRQRFSLQAEADTLGRLYDHLL